LREKVRDSLPPVARAGCASIQGSVQVWWSPPLEPGPAIMALLDDAEQARHLRLRRPEDRARHATAHALVRLALGRLLDRTPAQLRFDRTCPQCGEPHGKPRLIGAGPEFSLTHSGGIVGVAVAEVPVGVDVEDIAHHHSDPVLEDEALTAAERAGLDDASVAERPAAFLQLWTRKEAVLKATGTGLTVPLRDVVVVPTGEPGALLPGSRSLRIWNLTPGTGFVGALAAESVTELTVRQGDATELLG
jgi:4'-phosphopantetheinyl transferase